MGLVTLRNTNPLGQVDLPIALRQGDPVGTDGAGCLEPGEEFEIDALIAGRPPTGDPDSDDYDPGEGLLAQLGNYEHVSGELVPAPDRVPGGKVDDVLAWVAGDPVKATAALEAEANRRQGPRSTLVDQLNDIAKGDDK